MKSCFEIRRYDFHIDNIPIYSGRKVIQKVDEKKLKYKLKHKNSQTVEYQIICYSCSLQKD
jgi:hypothetical protein